MIEVVSDNESIRGLFGYIDQAHDTWDKNRATLIQELNSD